MATLYSVKLAVTLRPVWHRDPPRIRFGIDDNLNEMDLKETATINFDFETKNNCQLSVEFLNKHNSDTVPDLGLDKAVIIENVSFFGIADPKFVWAGIYEPQYPEPWASQQRSQGVALKQQLSSHNYLSWNGKWTLTFTVPVFTWMHQTQDLGWIYG
jgi:hypothetical protein